MRTPRSGRGFTLLEVLVVVALVGIIGAAVVVSISARGDRQLEATAEHLQNALNHASESAVISGRAYGLYVGPTAFETVVFDGEHWQPSPGAASGQRLSPPYRLRGNGVYALKNRTAPAPQMVFMPDGTHYLGEVVIENGISGESLAIEASGAGRYLVVRIAGAR